MSDSLKDKARKIVQQRNLCCYMNDTKWKELRNAMINEMPFQPPYILKFLFEDYADGENRFSKDVNWLGDWQLGDEQKDFIWNSIEWIKVRPRYLKYRGQLIEPEIIDAEYEFKEVLKKYSIPYEEADGIYCIYGYR